MLLWAQSLRKPYTLLRPVTRGLGEWLAFGWGAVAVPQIHIKVTASPAPVRTTVGKGEQVSADLMAFAGVAHFSPSCAISTAPVSLSLSSTVRQSQSFLVPRAPRLAQP